jgi:hypothetical protein
MQDRIVEVPVERVVFKDNVQTVTQVRVRVYASRGVCVCACRSNVCARVRGVCIESAVGVCARVYIHANLNIQMVAGACVSVSVYAYIQTQ